MSNKNPFENKIVEGDCLNILKQIEDESIDCIVTDPPYALISEEYKPDKKYSGGFMNKKWDSQLVSIEIWKECLRILKSGAFAFIMCTPRQDVLARQIINLQNAGFKTNFTSIYWSYASGFPKAANVSKLVDKRYKEKPEYNELAKYLKESRESKSITIKELAELFPSKTGGITGCVWNWENAQNVPTEPQYEILKDKLGLDDRYDWLIQQETKRYEEAEREIIGKTKNKVGCFNEIKENKFGTLAKHIPITKSATEQAKKLDGSYAGFQPKPALETILVVMKPLSEKSFVDQALSNQKGITWLDDCRIPFQNENDMERTKVGFKIGELNKRFFTERDGYTLPSSMKNREYKPEERRGRFPANLIVSDDVLNDGKISKSNGHRSKVGGHKKEYNIYGNYKQFEREEIHYNDEGSYSRYFDLDKWYEAQFIICPKASASERNKGLENEPLKIGGGMKGTENQTLLTGSGNIRNNLKHNHHPTVKPIKLMSYLITMGSRENDIILDPFCGSGTTCIAAFQLTRRFIGIELNKEYVDIANKRLEPYKIQNKITQF